MDAAAEEGLSRNMPRVPVPPCDDLWDTGCLLAPDTRGTWRAVVIFKLWIEEGQPTLRIALAVLVTAAVGPTQGCRSG